MRLAYLCSRYPWISHTFVLREVRALRGLGVAIETFAVVTSDSGQLRTDADREAFASTEALRPVRVLALGAALARLVGRRAGWRTAAFALHRGRARPRDTLWQLFYLVEAELLRAALERRGLHHLHVHFANPAADVALLATRLSHERGDDSPLRFSFTMHGPTEFQEPDRNRLAEKARAAAFVVCISEYARAQLERVAGPEVRPRLEVVHCGVDLGRFASVQREPRDETTILCVGRLVAEKGQTVLLDGLAALRRNRQPVRLVLVGDGPTRAALETRARELCIDAHVTFAGAVGQDEIGDWYTRADVFCLPSFAEGVPVALMEAMATELPVITTPVAGIPELVEHGVSGLLVEPGDADVLADALATLTVDPSLRRRMGAAGRARVLAEFDIDRCAAELHRVYQRRLDLDCGPAPAVDSTTSPGAVVTAS
jgi:colanic acid/amylovoran biosynthesis glycosyltransferase